MNFLQFSQTCLEQQDYATLVQACHTLQSQSGTGYEALEYVLDNLAQQGGEQHIESINKTVDDSHPLKGLILFYIAGLAAKQADITLCKKLMGQALAHLQKHLPFLVKNDNVLHSIKVKMKQLALITPDLDLSQQELTLFDVPDGTGIAPVAVVVASCNGTYFDRFANAFIQSIPADMICHIVVTNPSSGFDERLKKLQESYKNLYVTTENGPDEATYYACRRFQVLHHLLSFYKCPVLVSDIDVTLNKRISELANLKNVSCALFKAKSLAPMLIMHLSLSVYFHTPQTLNFLRTLDRYLGHHLQQGYVWTLDQCAFLTCALTLQKTDKTFDVFDLNQIQDYSLSAFQTNQHASYEEKLSLRQFCEDTTEAD